MGFSKQEYWSGLPFPSPRLCLPQCRHFTGQQLPPSPCSLLPCSGAENTPSTPPPPRISSAGKAHQKLQQMCMVHWLAPPFLSGKTSASGLEPKLRRHTVLWGETRSLVTESSRPHHLRGQHKPKEVAFVWARRWGTERSFRVSKSGQRNAKPGCATGGHPGWQLLPARTSISSCLELPWWSRG